MSAPKPPSSRLAATLPVRVLARKLPKPLIAADAGEDEVLDLGGDLVGDRGFDRVGAAAGGLDHHVEAVVDNIGIVADAALHGVGAGAAVELVGARIADQHIHDGVAGAVDVAGSGQRQILQLGGQHED